MAEQTVLLVGVGFNGSWFPSAAAISPSLGEFVKAMNKAEKPELVPGSGEVDPFGG